jgi:hypothetical protein
MFKRSLLTFFALLLLASVSLISLWPLFALKDSLEPSTLLLVCCLWGAGAALSFLVALRLLISKIWVFRGTGEPATLEHLQELLLGINDTQGPLQVIRKGQRLVFTWRYHELQWCERFSRLSLNRLYELHCRFDPDTCTVLLLDRMRTADFLICPDQVKIGWLRIPLPLFRVRPRRLGTIAQYATLGPEAYQFHPREIKAPVMGTLLASGWNVRFRLF